MGIGTLLAGFALAAAAIVANAQTPETTYQKLHAAVLAKNVDEVMRYATNARRAELAANPAAAATLEAMSAMLPKIYTVTGSTVSPDGNSAQLRASGSTEVMGQRAPMYGMADMRKEAGEWRVEQWSWSSDRPAMGQSAPAKPQKAAAAAGPAAKAKPEAKAEPKESEPVKPAPDLQLSRTSAVPPCVVKPVMSDQDLRNCGATPPAKYEKPVTK